MSLKTFVCSIAVLFFFKLNFVCTQSDMKSSLTFVIDSTMSMHDDIDAVKESANEIFDTVTKSNASQIEDFILVIFRDPDVHLLTITKNRDEFKKQLAAIQLIGNWDCPEYSMSGIEEALKVSRDGSFMYVFTDAAAKDASKYETVEKLAVKKGVQVVFLLTGECPEHDTGNDEVYNTLADATSGQVFNLYKSQVGTVLNYVKEQIKARQTNIFRSKFPPGDHTFNYVVDGNMKELVVSVTGTNPRIGLTDPFGNIAETEDIVRTNRIAIVKVTEVKPGVYKADVSSETETKVSVAGTSTAHFEHGFSLLAPMAIEETSTKPFPDQASYMSVKLTTEGGAVLLQTIQILDLNYNVIIEKQLDLINEKDQFYITTEPFVPPNISFRIAIKGLDVATKLIITRYGLVPMEPQDVKTVATENKAPVVTIVGKPKINVDYEDSRQLKCRVSGHPKPSVTWEDSKGLSLPSTVSQIAVPYDYVSTMDIDSVTQNNTYTCKARNDFGADSKEIEVETKRTRYFDVLETPKGEEDYLRHEVDWIRDGGLNKPLDLSSDIFGFPHDVFLHRNDSIVMKIKVFKTNRVGTCLDLNDSLLFTCRNTAPQRLDEYNVIPTDAEIEYEKQGQFVCKVDAAPEPATIKWFREHKKLREGQNYHISSDGSVLTIKSMQPYLVGNFKCKAMNYLYKKTFRFKITTSGIEPPKIKKDDNKIFAKQGSDVKLTCRVTQGKPKPAMRWFFKDKSNQLINIKGDETILLKNVHLKNAGTYRCEANNAAGEDYYYKDLIIESPPVVTKTPKKPITAIEGETIKLPCEVHGVPEPDVKWFLDGIEINRTKQYHLHKSHSLSFSATVESSGTYTCQAVNDLGNAVSTPVWVNVIVPVTIESPKESTLSVPVGDTVKLPCLADGYPQPDIQWEFRSSVDPNSPIEVSTIDTEATLTLSRIQINSEGFYTCIATNDGSSANITYEVKVLSPPQIVNVRPDKKYTAVDGDLVLAVPCKTLGNPKPDIIWKKDGWMNIASGTEWYDVDSDGALIIKNIEKNSAGPYTCEATNDLGNDRKVFEVTVDDYPKPGRASSTIITEMGNSTFIPCDVPHKKTDLLRWFKDGKEIGRGELYLNDVKTSEAGLYTCRVSTFAKSTSENILFKVGSKPRFAYDADSHIEFEEGIVAVMDCNAVGEPTPKVTWWHNRQQIKETHMTHVFDMKMQNRGRYFCLAKNQFGSVVRSFEISSRECTLGVGTEFEGNQPMIVTSNLKWPAFEIIDGYARIPLNESFILSCPGDFKNIPQSEIKATCDQGTNFNVNGNIYKYSDLKCKDEFEPVIISNDQLCDGEDTDTLKIGYEIRDIFIEVYDVCFDKNKNLPVYVKHKIDNKIASIEMKNTKWFDTELLPLNFDDLYDCDSQLDGISRILRSYFHTDDNCCFSKRQLISSRDVLPGLSQLSTFSHLNIVPQWSTCNAKNWEILERRVRKLAKSADNPLLVWTGTTQNLRMRGDRNMEDIKLRDQDRNRQQVPLYLWKVIQDSTTQASIAIVSVNVPDLKLSEARRHLHCRDICNEIHWMKSSKWHDVTRGYTYCCSITDFKAAFGFDDVFQRGFDKVLQEVTLSPSNAI